MEVISIYVWLAIIVICGIIEATTLNIVTAWFVVGGIVAVIAKLAGASALLQTILFIGVSLLCILALRPLVVKALKNKNPEKFNKDAIIGKMGVVTSEIGVIGNEAGEVKVNGKIWRAKSEKQGSIEKDTAVKILSIKGVTLTVEECENC